MASSSVPVRGTTDMGVGTATAIAATGVDITEADTEAAITAAVDIMAAGIMAATIITAGAVTTGTGIPIVEITIEADIRVAAITTVDTEVAVDTITAAVRTPTAAHASTVMVAGEASMVAADIVGADIKPS